MKTILIMTGLLLLISGNALAGTHYDDCLKQGKILKAKETSDCSGLRYLLDPSSCFKTRKELKEHIDVKCAAIGTAEQVDPGTPKTVQQDKAAAVPPKPAGPAPLVSVSGKNADSVAPAPPQKLVVPAESSIVSTCDQVRTENIRLKGENDRLRSENERLRKLVPH